MEHDPCDAIDLLAFSGAGMRIQQDHLPKATGYDAEDLCDLEDAVLVGLLLECVEWRIGVEEARKAIMTAPARTVWNALVLIEIEMVTDAHDRVADDSGRGAVRATHSDCLVAGDRETGNPASFQTDGLKAFAIDST